MTFLSHSVRDFRLKMMRDLMKRDRLDALIFTTADFFQFATNFHVDVQPWERPILACVTLEGEPQAIMNELSTHHMMMAKERGHVWVKDVQFYAEHPKVAERQFLLPQLPEMIAEFLRKLGLSSSRIGVDGSFSALARAAATLPRLKRGDVLVNIVIPRLNGIVVENERTWFAGEPSEDQRRYYEVARAANEAAAAAAVTGRPVSGIDAAAQNVIEAAGCGKFIRHRTGHGMGILVPEAPEDMAFNNRALLENEVYSAEPGIYVYGLGGFRMDDTVVAGRSPEILTKAPKDIKSQIVG